MNESEYNTCIMLFRIISSSLAQKCASSVSHTCNSPYVVEPLLRVSLYGLPSALVCHFATCTRGSL